MLTSAQNGMMIGGIFGAFILSRNEYVHFISTEEPFKYKSHLQAKDQMRKKLSLGLARGCLAWGSRVAALCFLWK